MTSEEFVKNQHPDALCLELANREYGVLKEYGEGKRIGIGKTKSGAWVNAKNRIKKQNHEI